MDTGLTLPTTAVSTKQLTDNENLTEHSEPGYEQCLK